MLIRISSGRSSASKVTSVSIYRLNSAVSVGISSLQLLYSKNSKYTTLHAIVEYIIQNNIYYRIYYTKSFLITAGCMVYFEVLINYMCLSVILKSSNNYLFCECCSQAYDQITTEKC